MEDKEWDKAAVEMMDSRWATQVGARATRLKDRVLKQGEQGKNMPKKKSKKKVKKLTKRQQEALKRHSKHHTSKHMSQMKKMMRQGKTFKESHQFAMKKVGK